MKGLHSSGVCAGKPDEPEDEEVELLDEDDVFDDDELVVRSAQKPFRKQPIASQVVRPGISGSTHARSPLQQLSGGGVFRSLVQRHA